MAGVAGELLEVVAEGAQVGRGADVAFEEDNGADAVVLDEGLDVIVDLGVVEADGKELHGELRMQQTRGSAYLSDLFALLKSSHLVN